MIETSDIWTQSKCLTLNQMQQYLAQQLEPEEVRLVETHLCECMLCSDAIDGFMESGMPAAEDLQPLKEQLQTLIKPKVEPAPTIIKSMPAKSPLKPQRKDFRWAWAASILLFMGLGGYGIYVLNDHGEVLVHEKGQSQSEIKDAAYNKPDNASGEIIQLKVDSIDALNQSTAEVPTTNSESMASDSKEKSDVKLLKPVEEASKNLATKDQKIPQVEKSVETLEPEIKNAPLDDATESDGSYALDINKNESAPALAKEAAPIPINKKVVSGAGLKNNNDRSLYSSPQSNQLNYSSSNRNANETNSFEEVVRQKAGSEGSLRKGRKAVQKGNYKEAIQILEPLMQQSQGEEKEEIMYYLAQAYLNSGQTLKAETLIAALSSSQKYSIKAKELKSESLKTKKK